QIRLLDFFDIQARRRATVDLLDCCLKLSGTAATSADDHAGLSRHDSHGHQVRRTRDLHLVDGSPAAKLVGYKSADRQIIFQELGVFAFIDEPLAAPVFVDLQSHRNRIHFLSHYFFSPLLLVAGSVALAGSALTTVLAGSAVLAASAFTGFLASRISPSTTTRMCEVLRWKGKARPWATGR